MNNRERIRDSVSKAYTNAVSSSSKEGCCDRVPKGVAVKAAGYTAQELGELPDETVVNSFGCGNPLAFSGVKEGDVVVDLGAGAGIDVLLAARKVGPSGRAIGIDRTEAMLRKAREAIRAAGLPNAEVRKGDIEKLPLESESVDWVISNCVINLSPEKSRVFAEITRVLKPGGKMLVSDIVADALPPQVRANEALYTTCIAGAIGEADYCEGLRNAGLVDVEIRERIEYEPVQIHGLIESDLVAAGWESEEPTEKTALDLARQCEGKVWSANIYARKPGP